jgi:transposase
VEHQTSEQTEILREILKWIKFAGAKEVKNVLLATLDNEQKRLIYHLSDGNRGSLEIAKAAGISDTTVRRYWASWARQGIVESLKVRGGERYKKSFELEDFGIEGPQPKSSVQPNEAKEVTETRQEEIE